MNVLPTHSLSFLLFDMQRSESLFTGSKFFPSVLVKFHIYNNKKALFPECLPVFPSSFFPHFTNDSQIHNGDFEPAGNLPLSTERRSLCRQREPETKVYFEQNGVWGFLPQQGGTAVKCTVINLIQRWERRKNDCIGKGLFFKYQM